MSTSLYIFSWVRGDNVCLISILFNSSFSVVALLWRRIRWTLWIFLRLETNSSVDERAGECVSLCWGEQNWFGWGDMYCLGERNKLLTTGLSFLSLYCYMKCRSEAISLWMTWLLRLLRALGDLSYWSGLNSSRDWCWLYRKTSIFFFIFRLTFYSDNISSKIEVHFSLFELLASDDFWSKYS